MARGSSVLKSAVKFSLKENDRGWRELKKRLAQLKQDGSYVKVGVIGDEARDDAGGMTMVRLAGIHEFGAPSANIPQRSFIRSTFKIERKNYQAILRRLLPVIFEARPRMTVAQILGLLGQRMVADIRRRITQGEGILPANTPEVFMRKLMKGQRGFNKSGAAPRVLVDTGQLVNSLTYEVVIQKATKEKGK